MVRPTISITRTDATEARWPPNYELKAVPITTNENYHEKLGRDHPKSVLFRDKIGQHLATWKGLPDADRYTLLDLPKGYSLFYHHKLQKDGSDRTDVYMYGSEVVTKFRSPNEFFPHAEWLMKTEDGADHKTCECKYSGGTVAGTSVSTPQKGKRKAEDSGRPAKRSKEEQAVLRRMVDARSEAEHAGANRLHDIAGRRMFRLGELVWAKLPEAISNPNPENTSQPKVIDRWPAIIIRHDVRKHHVVDDAAAQPAASSSSAAASSPTKTLESYQFKVRYIGRIMANHRSAGGVDDWAYVTIPETDVLPYALIPVAAELGALHNHVEDMVDKYVKHHSTSQEELTKAKTEWKTELIKKSKSPISSFAKPERWDLLCLHYGYALKIAESIAHTWVQTDGYQEEVDPPAVVPGLAAPRKKTSYQGIWWGPERIWNGDLVRLNKSRSSLPAGSFLAPSPNSFERGLYLRISNICIEEDKVDNEPTYRCLIHGDLYDVVDADWLAEQEKMKPPAATAADSTAKTVDESPYPLPPPPSGCAFRQINPADTEVTCDISDISGRLYTRLGISPWLKALHLEDSVEARCLTGRSDGTKLATHASDWKETRRKAITEHHCMADKWIDSLIAKSSATVTAPSGTQAGPSSAPVAVVANGSMTLQDALDASQPPPSQRPAVPALQS